ncbi:MAG: DNA polymerase III subunit beta [Betaproteobacteria bacterium]|nr:MAG: DNA polymerase III subunit beta [Betaproteobacteria bacterium]TAG48706.1 MAG: DNA polymerase III subunit beta [Betaproteobacteria bacterium]
MQLKNISRDLVLKPLQAVSGIVERRQTLPILANVLLEHRGTRLTTVATDLELQISASVEVEASGDQSITVAARKLQDLLRALPDASSVSLDAKDGKMTVKAAKSRFSLQTLPASDYPRLTMSQEQLQSFSLPQKLLKSTLRLVEFAMAQQDIRFYLNGMLFVLEKNQLICVATDGHRLSYASMPIEGDFAKQEIIVPRKTVMELSKLLADTDEPLKVDILSNQVRFSFGNIELTSKVIDGKFPDYNRVIPSAHTKIITIERALLLQTLQRAAILSNERFRGVRIGLAPSTLKIACTNNEQEEAEEEIEIAYDGGSMEIGFNINYLLDALATVSSTEVTMALQDSAASVLFTVPGRSDFKYVVMPMRI